MIRWMKIIVRVVVTVSFWLGTLWLLASCSPLY